MFFLKKIIIMFVVRVYWKKRRYYLGYVNLKSIKIRQRRGPIMLEKKNGKKQKSTLTGV